MVAPSERSRVGDHPRDAIETEWEVFVREETDRVLKHVGAITAPDVQVAYEQATKLFAWYADDVWLCPADAFTRFSTHDLDANATETDVDRGEEERSYE